MQDWLDFLEKSIAKIERDRPELAPIRKEAEADNTLLARIERLERLLDRWLPPEEAEHVS